jgi:hypothetical protein
MAFRERVDVGRQVRRAIGHQQLMQLPRGPPQSAVHLAPPAVIVDHAVEREAGMSAEAPITAARRGIDAAPASTSRPR